MNSANRSVNIMQRVSGRSFVGVKSRAGADFEEMVEHRSRPDAVMSDVGIAYDQLSRTLNYLSFSTNLMMNRKTRDDDLGALLESSPQFFPVLSPAPITP